MITIQAAENDSVEFTDNEMRMLKAFYDESIATCGSCNRYENLSYMNASDLLKVLGGTKQSIGGTMSSLDSKSAITDTMESARRDRLNDWVLDDWVADYFNSLQEVK